MAFKSIEVEGIAGVCAILDDIPKVVAARGYLAGLKAAGNVFESALWPRTPVDQIAALNKAHGGKGALITRIVQDIEIDANGRGGVVDVGFGPLGHIALWVEYGHNQVTGGRLATIKNKAGKGKLVGFTPAHPFMRPAFDASAERAVDAFVVAVKQVLDREVAGYSEAA